MVEEFLLFRCLFRFSDCEEVGLGIRDPFDFDLFFFRVDEEGIESNVQCALFWGLVSGRLVESAAESFFLELLVDLGRKA